jgi:hypothetical protein
VTDLAASVADRALVIERTQALAVSIADACELLPFGRDLLEELIEDAGFPCIRIGRKKAIPVAAAERWLEEHIGMTIPTRKTTGATR